MSPSATSLAAYKHDAPDTLRMGHDGMASS